MVTRLTDLVNSMDPKVVAAASDMDAESVMIYLADRTILGGRPPPGAEQKPPGRVSRSTVPEPVQFRRYLPQVHANMNALRNGRSDLTQ
jgi:hypothetical protein